ncbi:dihydrolipoyl dehydrogenase [bacterium]|nr:MAG: dihydrolipoyl dehydrogenase [bacterium]
MHPEPQSSPALPASPTLIPEGEATFDFQEETDNLEEIDAESVVEAAELLLREGAPHDFDVIVIGAGPGGLACATHLAQGRQSVAIIEREELGGVCLNRGCIPTKTLLESIGALRLVRRASNFGITLSGTVTPDLRQMQQRKREVVASLRIQSEQLAEEAGVQILRGNARLLGENTIEFAESNGTSRQLSAVHIVIATGGIPSRLPVPGADLEGVLTSDQILELEEIPRRLIVLGAGAIGVEFAAIFAELGCHTTILEKMTAVLPGEDEDIQQEMKRSLKASNIEVITSADIECIEDGSQNLRVIYRSEGLRREVEAEIVLMATGRKANIEQLGLEKAGIEANNGVIVVKADGSTQTTGVWAIGDCVRRVGWAHQAALEGRRVADAILGVENNIDDRFIPACYYTFPEVASVGLTLKEAQKAGLEARVGRCAFRDNGRANTSGDNGGFVKLVVEITSGKLLGAQIIGPRATELINEIAVALRSGATADDLADALHAHPTFAEVLPGAARAALRESH